ncbi:inorganic phosphate transporter PHO84 [Colletotrichum liriopes]|uniref:Inorganic phosphate transporter PHO84 n=1 Tax=Colletotrichum liriopes TaxID=708192 RepID=A0AA37GU53_9PEZI|nr:inorganic phosphate transporter PHO84 [Colletotrichum liriopes]
MSALPDPLVRRNRGFLGSDSSALSARDRQDRDQLRYELDLNSWNLRIWGVAASGFLTDSYNLFSTNVILASIAFVYWPSPGARWQGLLINFFTLLGSVIGQLLFGFLADFYGRTRLYGIELVLVIVSTIGVATSSYGFDDMSFLGLFIWTFMMQPIGQALAQLVGLWVLLGREKSEGLQAMQCGLDMKFDRECRRTVDGIWRIVIGSGAVPALLAIIFRFFLFDCGLYSLEVRNKPGIALRNTQRVYGAPPVTTAGYPLAPNDSMHATNPQQPMPIQFSKDDLYKYFIEDGNWYYLLAYCHRHISRMSRKTDDTIGTAATWFFLDVSFYGLSLDNRGTLSDMWATTGPTPIDDRLPCWNSKFPDGNATARIWSQTGLPVWQTDATLPCNTIYDVLLEQAKQYLLTVSIASIAGSACFVMAANRIPRRLWLTVSFFVLAILFVITGCVYYGVNRTPGAPATVVFVALCHFMFNFGANTLTFIIPAEIFPTCYRCTCHGISAAAGKLGSIVALLVVYGINSSYTAANRQGLIFLLFGSFVAVGAVFSWAYLPDSQRWVVDEEGRRVLEQKTLEELGEGRERARQLGEVITVKEKWHGLKRRRASPEPSQATDP